MKLLAKGLTLLALFLYGPGILLPALHVEKLGRCRDTCILDGCTHLFSEGEIFLGVVVGLTAVVLPPLKLATLLWCGASMSAGVVPRSRLFRALEVAGRFGCLEVFLAVLITFLRLNALVSFRVLTGLYVFAFSAFLGLAASAALSAASTHRENSHESCAA